MPTLALSPGSGCLGDTIRVTGSGFSASSPITAVIDYGAGVDVTLSPATTDGSGNIDSTFEIPPVAACLTCHYSVIVTDADDNTAEVDFKFCCPRAGDGIDPVIAQLDPVVDGGTGFNILDYIHHDGNHYIIVATGPDGGEAAILPPDPTIHAATVYVIPDDGSGITSFPVDTDYCYSFALSGFDSFHCGTWFTRHFHCTGWSLPIYDARFASDGTNLWLAVLTAKTEEYPYITAEGQTCAGTYYPGQIEQLESLPTVVDGLNHFRFVRTDTTTLGFYLANAPYSDGGENLSGYWTTPRLRMFSLSPSAATDIGYIDANYYPGATSGAGVRQPHTANKGKKAKLLSGVSVAASAAEVGVCHVVWAEGGGWGACDGSAWDGDGPPNIDYRIDYSKWDTGGVLADADLFHSHIDRTAWNFTYDDGQGAPYYYGYTWPTTAEIAEAFSRVFQVVNDGGSPVLFLAPAATEIDPFGVPDSHGNPFLDNVPYYPDASSLAAYDLSTGAAVLMQSFDPSLLPAVGDVVDSSFGSGFNALQALAVSLPYADPLLSGVPVYLVNVPWSYGGAVPLASGFYRIPVDLSSGFDYLDGIRAIGYSILTSGGGSTPSPNPGSAHSADVPYRRFWSDPHGVWVPGGWHLDRECSPFWNQFYVTVPAYGSVPAFQPSFSWDGSDFVYSMQYQGTGADYKVAQAHILRGIFPCNCPDLHIWQRF